ncbi:MAG: D-aminoacyl-tRNA deacylase [Oscillospiraceae bacterium]|nr:D-aminoacyl-tRNA deacylase [Ruminococcus sp.]MDD7337877.1 D-aminoacyl-tRNA deacylase [Ruminococcus sp.]MDY6061444.1 D-aminoacyl-tRNA deacylase [Oscillospiraceae bacterium]
MKAVVQRVTASSVSVDGEIVGKIDKGLNVLLGVEEDDTEKDAEVLASKIAKMRIFEDENEKMNLSVLDVDGSVLVISQFTLCADIKKGNRPSFILAAKPDKATALYEYFSSQLKENGVKKVENGVFGADMAVEISNDGPVTIIMDTAIWRKG